MKFTWDPTASNGKHGTAARGSGRFVPRLTDPEWVEWRMTPADGSRSRTVVPMKFRSAVALVLGIVALAAGIASAVAATSFLTVTSARTRVTYQQVSLEVPKGWAVTTQPTCLSQTTKLVLYTPATGLRRDTVSVSEVAHNQSATCRGTSRLIMVKLKWEHITIHGIRMKALEGGGFFNAKVAALKLWISGTGPGAVRVIRTLHRT